MINDNKPIPIVIKEIINDAPSGLRGVTNYINPSPAKDGQNPPSNTGDMDTYIIVENITPECQVVVEDEYILLPQETSSSEKNVT